MLLVVTRGKEDRVRSIFEKWDLPAAAIGEVTGDGLLRFLQHGQLEAEIPARELVLGGGAPQYDREWREPAYMEQIRAFDASKVPLPSSLRESAARLLQIPNIASKKWVAVQYDSTVGAANASTNAPSDASVVLVKGSRKALAMTTDCNSRYVHADPYQGTMIAVAEAARNIVCSGGTPLGVTNCLNFGNPYDPEVYYQFVRAVQGMSEACLRLGTPVTGGNVSFYNQNPEGPVYPTPTIGMVGLLSGLQDRMTLDFKSPGDMLVLLGKSRPDIHCSEYLHKIIGVQYSPPPHFDLDEECRLQERLAGLIADNLIRSAHDVSEGGLFVTLMESAFPGSLGFSVRSADPRIRPDGYWFGESQSRVLVSLDPEDFSAFKEFWEGLPFERLGAVTPGAIQVDGEDWGEVESWKQSYESSLETRIRSASSVLDLL
jgi:phosphoribosylformylglycinamidine synthase